MSPREVLLNGDRRASRRFLALLNAAGVRVRPDELIVDRERRALTAFSASIRAALGQEPPKEPIARPDQTVSDEFYCFWRKVTA